jgi:hypothetical protein
VVAVSFWLVPVQAAFGSAYDPGSAVLLWLQEQGPSLVTIHRMQKSELVDFEFIHRKAFKKNQAH